MARYEEDDYDGDDRVVLRTPEGRAAILPKSAGRLGGDALEVYADLMGVGLQVAELEDRLGQLVDQARELGVSWSLIGSATGLTGEGARQRYGASSRP
jgi:hypothetical protein